MEMIRTWLTGIVCAAMVAAIAETLCPEGTVRRIGRMTGGLFLLLAILQPVIQWRDIDLEAIIPDYRLQTEAYSDQLEQENQKLMEKIIEEEVGAYIVDKAEGLGFACTARVETVTDDQTGTPTPWAVEIRGHYTMGQRDALSRQIEDTLDIPAARQTYQWEEVE